MPTFDVHGMRHWNETFGGLYGLHEAHPSQRGDIMNDEDMSMAVLRSRCAQMKIDVSEVLAIFDCLRPKLDEAKIKLQECEITSKDMLYAFDMDEVMKEAGKPNYMHMYPRPTQSIVAWSGAFSKILDNQASNLAYAERLALKMVNYMVYAECVYANLVNQLCYALANSKDPQHLERLKRNTNMELIARNIQLKPKVEFLKLNLPDIPNAPDITEACDIDLRNMIAHGNFAGNPPLAPYSRQLKINYQLMSAPIYVRRWSQAAWKWEETPVDLDVVYERMCSATRTWHAALWYYRNIAYGSWKLFPESWQTQTGTHYLPDRSCGQAM